MRMLISAITLDYSEVRSIINHKFIVTQVGVVFWGFFG